MCALAYDSMLLAYHFSFSFHYTSVYRQLYSTPLEHYPLLASKSLQRYGHIVQVQCVDWEYISCSFITMKLRYCIQDEYFKMNNIYEATTARRLSTRIENRSSNIQRCLLLNLKQAGQKYTWQKQLLREINDSLWTAIRTAASLAQCPAMRISFASS